MIGYEVPAHKRESHLDHTADIGACLHNRNMLSAPAGKAVLL